MALRYLNVPTGRVVTVPEPHEVAAKQSDPHTGKWLAMHQRRTIATMDRSNRWRRVEDQPAAEKPASAPEPAAVPEPPVAPEPEPEPLSAETEPVETVEVGEATVERPKQKYPKQPWVEWAVATGRLSREDANDLTVDELMHLD